MLFRKSPQNLNFQWNQQQDNDAVCLGKPHPARPSNFSAGFTHFSLLHAQGANSYGQLGLGYKSEEVLEPQVVAIDNADLKSSEIVSICGGAGHTLVLDARGYVYCCGWNSKGQLGLSDDTVRFQQIEILKEFKIVQISCGWDFSAAVSSCGKQFVWGNNAYTQLGLSKSITCTGIPSLLQVSQKLATGFREVSCGLRHSAMITKEGGLLVAGTGSKGQLGLGDNYNDDNYLSITRVPNIEGVVSIEADNNHQKNQYHHHEINSNSKFPIVNIFHKSSLVLLYKLYYFQMHLRNHKVNNKNIH